MRRSSIDITCREKYGSHNCRVPRACAFRLTFKSRSCKVGRLRETYPTRRKKSGSSLIASANWTDVSVSKNKYGGTHPSFFYHVFYLLHGGIQVVTGKVVQHAERRDL